MAETVAPCWLAGGGRATLDPFVALTAAAAASPRLQLQTHILVLAYRNPFVVAKAAASLDALAGGLLILGIGTGYLKPEYAAVGVSFEDRGEITDESIHILRQAWTGEPVQHEGPRFTARDVVILPRPPRAEGIPIRGRWQCEPGDPSRGRAVRSLVAVPGRRRRHQDRAHRRTLNHRPSAGEDRLCAGPMPTISAGPAR
ncbi:LLM class flavin-dependent oxidoreductase [Novosphingobium sp. PS1R-30]|uniref:LLM class flavin-dependent oxidoreductase n=1 Tax=Novosphingobium anseongense TaxID=3133436 RepID=A0ABU8S285_9SPHN